VSIIARRSFANGAVKKNGIEVDRDSRARMIRLALGEWKLRFNFFETRQTIRKMELEGMTVALCVEVTQDDMIDALSSSRVQNSTLRGFEGVEDSIASQLEPFPDWRDVGCGDDE
jgi:hypothetical protein